MNPGRRESQAKNPCPIGNHGEYLLLDPARAWEEPYKMHLKIGSPEIKSEGSSFLWAPVPQWSRYPADPDPRPHRSVGILCHCSGVARRQEYGFTGQTQSCQVSVLADRVCTQLVEAYEDWAPVAAFEIRCVIEKTGAVPRRLWDTFACYDERLQWESQMSPFLHSFSIQSTTNAR